MIHLIPSLFTDVTSCLLFLLLLSNFVFFGTNIVNQSTWYSTIKWRQIHFSYQMSIPSSSLTLRFVPILSTGKRSQERDEQELFHYFVKAGSPIKKDWSRISVPLPLKHSFRYYLQFEASGGISRQYQTVSLTNITLSKECFAIGMNDNKIISVSLFLPFAFLSIPLHVYCIHHLGFQWMQQTLSFCFHWTLSCNQHHSLWQMFLRKRPDPGLIIWFPMKNPLLLFKVRSEKERKTRRIRIWSRNWCKSLFHFSFLFSLSFLSLVYCSHNDFMYTRPLYNHPFSGHHFLWVHFFLSCILSPNISLCLSFSWNPLFRKNKRMSKFNHDNHQLLSLWGFFRFFFWAEATVLC